MIMSSASPIIDSNQETRGLHNRAVVRVNQRTAEESEANNELPVTPSGSPNQNHICKLDIARDDLAGLSLGPYALGSKIGGGGMGKVFTAKHVTLDRSFAIKFIGSSANAWPESRIRFEQEIKALGKLQHLNIVSAVDAGCVEGMQYLVTELLEGEDLSQLVQRQGALPIAEACELIRQVAVGLAYSHRAGFLHRDIKPSNLILDRSGIVKIIDFGLVRSADMNQSLTVVGEMLGTWDYVAPEQAQDARLVDHRTDIYSLGCTLLFLLSGHPPFSNARYSTAAAKLKGHLFDQPAWLENRPVQVPAELAALVARMLAKSPDDRFNTADDVAEALAPWASGASVTELFTSPSSQPSAHETTAPKRLAERRWWKLSHVLTASGALIAAGLLFFVTLGRTAPSVEERPYTVPVAPVVVAETSPTATLALTPTPPEQPPVISAVESSLHPARVTRETPQTIDASATRVRIPVASSPAFKHAVGSARE